MDTHNITSIYNKGMSFTSHVDGHKVVTDSNSEGISDGPSPKRLMLASLAGCTGIDVVSILDKMKVKFSKNGKSSKVIGRKILWCKRHVQVFYNG
jgi:putative redox protein